ncbi:hypothetical protein O0I10_007844 [Lichtheimia ornata]|uniref:RecQ-mediated genome instability protein 1 n=1 Tax=Lichtheimia ornata TaxID=688661 RepID=A0AAD7V0Z1_9FUNG|nr:uncharacterized protein O0I10_007844 [Lichtheimia ornata]KAJ8656521.1 hypothetical protein O0I10_007844 [Lichtheimia ornata]
MSDSWYTLLRMLENELGVKAKREYVESWQQSQAEQFGDRQRMYEALKHDFLGRDMADTCLPTIPSDFGSDQLNVFPAKNTVLQIVDTKDMSHSTHSLLNDLATVTPVRQVYTRRATDADVNFPRGMLRWTLSDGTHQIVAIEMKRINGLQLKTPFGCKVRRGILLLEPSNVKILGGQVPSLYGQNMLAELEKRFKQQLRIEIDQTTTDTGRQAHNSSPSLAPSDLPVNSEIMRPEPEMPVGETSEDDFGDDMDIDDLEALERTLAASRHTTSSYASSTITTNTVIPTMAPSVTHDAGLISRQASQLPLSRSSPSTHTTSTTTTAVDETLATEIERMTVGMLRKMLKKDTTDMDTVIVTGQVKRIFKLKVTGMRMRLLARIRDPSTFEDLVVVWPDEVVSRELGKTAKDVLEMKEKEGDKVVTETLFKPFFARIHNVLGEMTLDLSILESYSGEEDMPDMPLVVEFKPLSSS